MTTRGFRETGLVALVSIGPLLASGLGAACGGKEIIVVHDLAPVSSASSASEGKGPTPLASGGTGDEGDGQGAFGIADRDDDAQFQKTIDKVTSMKSDGSLLSRVGRRGLSVVDVAWEDTGRAQGLALGPNISDLTLQVTHIDAAGRNRSAVMPVIRLPNFTDKSGDLSADRFFVRVNNERPLPADGDAHLESVPLRDFLKNIKAHAAFPGHILGSGDLTAPRDSHYLMSAQAVFLPIPKKGKAEFNPALFNYQSAPGSPAVLSILVTREGTSMSVIENRPEDRDASGRGQQIFFNHNGQRAAFAAERRSEVVERIEAHGGPKNEDERSAIAKGADVLFLIQVPLMHQQRGVLGGSVPGGNTWGPGASGGAGSIGTSGSGSGWKGGGASKAAKPSATFSPPSPPPAAAAPASQAAPSFTGKGRGRAADSDGDAREPSDMEQAVIGHGKDQGAFDEGRGLALVRDPKFPVRITVQFYKATSNGNISDKDLDSIALSIGNVYEHADFVGSLVMPEGDARRPTAWQKVPGEWFPW